MPEETKPLSVLCVGQEGFLLTDGDRLFMVWASRGSEKYPWTGLEIKDPSNVFSSGYSDLCGGEVDMRQEDTDPMTLEVMEIGDRVADALNRHFKETELRVVAEWNARTAPEKK